ncbi:hypothetical protein N0B31_14515 [Salinirubellus salinus]|uniref:DUF7511 domain-containing protein n=1 Tax=Salinirubellus salinus TaxID=1364945 RepID=A0A9E7R1X0_9EURY|nr:hypothetical protein [Salinirubellus salinus]UWM53348.1 hypothetical protein N0B31_14515 [Salinirubellus salinus]
MSNEYEEQVSAMGATPPVPNDREPPRPADEEPFVAVVTRRPDGEETCSISPPPTSERRLETEWVAASGDSFVSLAEMR